MPEDDDPLRPVDTVDVRAAVRDDDEENSGRDQYRVVLVVQPDLREGGHGLAAAAVPVPGAHVLLAPGDVVG